VSCHHPVSAWVGPQRSATWTRSRGCPAGGPRGGPRSFTPCWPHTTPLPTPSGPYRLACAGSTGPAAVFGRGRVLPPTPVTRGGGAGRCGPTAEVADGGCTGWTPGRPMIVHGTTRRPTLSHQRKRTGVRAFSTDVRPLACNHPRRCASPAEALWRYDQRQPPRTSVPKTRRQADHRHAPRDRRSGRRGGLRRDLQAGWRRPAHPRTRLAQAPHAQETGRKSRSTRHRPDRV
jgi:hypothetical protein